MPYIREFATTAVVELGEQKPSRLPTWAAEALLDVEHGCGRAWFEYQGAGAAVSTHGSTGQISSQRERTLVTHSPRSRRTVLGARSCLLLQQRQAGCHFVGFVGCLTCYVDSTSWYPPLLPEHRSRRTWRTISSTIPLAAAGFRRVHPLRLTRREIEDTILKNTHQLARGYDARNYIGYPEQVWCFFARAPYSRLFSPTPPFIFHLEQ